MDRFLSDTDIADFLDETGAPNIQIYEEITKYKHAKQLFQNNNKTYEYAVIFLPVQSKSVGHWQLVIKTEKAYYFFDSYGEMPNTKVDKYLGTSANLQKLLQQEKCSGWRPSAAPTSLRFGSRWVAGFRKCGKTGPFLVVGHGEKVVIFSTFRNFQSAECG